ncbi:TrbC/VIRB2 family protein (plasmid) [Pararobbsia alpina]|uniref:TrbC/VirB2 family protein n=1 Tax=Pararobbsia alpina TaxID=621374 RepID=UPI0039A6B87F
MQQYFKIYSIRDAVRVAVALSLATVCATPAFAVGSITDITSVVDVICMISNLISGPFLYGIGVVLIILGAVAIANSESTIGKFISVGLMGIGLASAAIPIMKNHMGIAAAC